MKKTLGNQEDIRKARTATDSGSMFLKIPDNKTPWYILDMDLFDGFAHWVPLPTGRKQRVVCAGDPETSGGFAPEDCPVCAHMLAGYQEAKALRPKGKKKAADALKDDMNEMRANYEAHFIAVRGTRMLLQTKAGKKWVATFSTEEDDSETEVGKLSLSHAQFLSLTGMIEDENVEHVKSGDDLCNRVLWTEKKQQGRRTYKEVHWFADKRKSDPPDIAIPDDLTLEEDFEYDEELMDKVASFLSGEDSELLNDDEEVEVDEDEDAGEEPEDGFLDDVEEGEEEGPIAGIEEDEKEEDDFEDDIPYGEDEDEEETLKPKTRQKSRKTAVRPARAKVSSKATSSRKATGIKKSSTSKSRAKSGTSAKAKSKSKGISKTKSGKTKL